MKSITQRLAVTIVHNSKLLRPLLQHQNIIHTYTHTRWRYSGFL